MNIFEKLRNGEHCHVIENEQYVREAHGEFARCGHICYLINQTDPLEKEKILELERELFQNNLPENSFLTPLFKLIVPAEFFSEKMFSQIII